MARSRRSKDAPSEFFPGFTDVDEIGSGSIATVYRAQAHGTGRQVALKVISAGPDPALLTAAEGELAGLGPLSSQPGVVPLFRHFRSEDGRLVLVLELCQGSLRDRLSDGRPMPVAEAVAAGVAIARVLESAHRLRVLHRDVTPGNILVTASGAPALGDFGLAGLRRPGSPSLDGALHVAPEVIGGRGPTPATDVYGLASSLYQLISGRPAFGVQPGEPPAAAAQRVLQEPVPPLVAAPAAVSELIVRAMAKDPAARPAGAAAFADQLAAATNSENVDWSSPILSRPPEPPPVEQTIRRSNLPPEFNVAPKQEPPPPIGPPPVDQPPVDQTVRRSNLPPEFRINEAPSSPPPSSPPPSSPPPPPDATVARGSLRRVPEAPAVPVQPPPPQPPNVEETVFRSGRPQLPPPSPPPSRSPGYGGSIALDPSALARRITLRSGRAAMVVDETGLTLRAFLRKKHIAWSDVSGFEARYDDPANPMTGGHLAAITTSGPVDLPATKRAMADLRYTQALLEAYRLRASTY